MNNRKKITLEDRIRHNLKPIMIAIGGILGVFVAACLLIYIFKFGNRGISNNTQDFAFFATLFTGTVGVALSFVNTALIVYMNKPAKICC